MSGIPETIRQPYNWVTEQDTLDLVPLLTSVTLLLHGGRRFWWVHVLIVAVVFGGIFCRPLLRTFGYWLTLSAIMLGSSLYYYHFTDNHEFLFSYWCVSLACCFLLPNPREALAINARWLIALVFLLATVWKIMAHSFLNGGTLHFVMLQHDEYFAFSRLFAGYTEEMAAFNRARLQEILPAAQEEIALQQPGQIHSVAKYLTWITFFGEAFVAVAFLIPQRRLTHHFRNISLLAFAAAVYPIVNVIAFGLVLMILGIAQCDERDKGYRFAYCLLFIVLTCFQGGQLKSLLLL